jgi:hypothetical protein
MIMAVEVYIIEGKDYGKLDKLLAADPYAKDSFKTVGYTLKESKAMGMKGGSYILYYKAEDPALLAALGAKIVAALPEAKKADAETKTKVESQIKQEEDNATAGFGSIFG